MRALGSCIFCRSRRNKIVAKCSVDLTGPICIECVQAAAGNGFFPRPLNGTAPLTPRDGVLLCTGKIKLDEVFRP